ncbi:MAG TPA: PH domain-containing protein [Phycisphaerales bacterium]|nr:PH domain-containing protein [Phycisphaerales bacterium]
MEHEEQHYEPFDPTKATRPDPALLHYYIIVSLFTVFAFPFVMLAMYFKFRSLRYGFDEKGISMSYGILWRKEMYLTYRRIQDIHVTRGLIQRWLGLASVSIQTASGTAGAEMTIEGLKNPEALRDFLYLKMRGVRDVGHEHGAKASEGGASAAVVSGGADDEAMGLLREIRDELKRIRASGGVK